MLETQNSVYGNESRPPRLALKALSCLPLLIPCSPDAVQSALGLQCFFFLESSTLDYHTVISLLPSRSWFKWPSFKFSLLLFHLSHSLSHYSLYPCLKLSCLFICDSHSFWLSFPDQGFKFPQGADICLFCSFLCLQSLLARSRCAVNICQVSNVDSVALVGLKVTVNQFS